MKKFVKYTAITALVLVVVGVVMLSIGAIGGSVQGIKVMDEVVKKVKAGEFSIDAEDLEVLEEMGVEVEEWLDELGIEPTFSVNADIKFNDNFPVYSGGTIDLDFDAAEVKKLVFSLATCDVEIKSHTGSTLSIDADFAGKMQAFVDGDTFYVLATNSGVNVSAGDFELQVPEGMTFEEVKFDFGAGSIDIDELQGGEVMVSVGAGDFDAKKLVADSVILAVGAGDATIRDGILGDVRAEVGAGNIDITAQITGEVKGDVALGNLSMVVKGSGKGDHNYQVDCAMGEVNVGDYSWAGLATSDIFINNNAETTYEFDCAMGNIDVRFVE